MVASVLERRGARLVHNRAGANMAGGVASALAEAARGGGRRVDGDTGLFEVDEFWLPQLLAELRPRAVLLANLFRDQLDRYGELETIGERWLEAVAALPAATALVLNADDPLVADLGRNRDVDVLRGRGRRAGAPGDAARGGLQALPPLRAPVRYDAIYLGHLGRYECPNCGAAPARSRPCVARDVELRGIRAAAFTLVTPRRGGAAIELPLPGLYNVYNALAAAALCGVLGASLAEIVAGPGRPWRPRSAARRRCDRLARPATRRCC